MADRRTDETPLAPRRTLSGSEQQESRENNRRPASERVARGVSGAVASASQTVRNATESRRNQRTNARGSGTTNVPRTAPPMGTTSRPRTRRARLRVTHVDPWSVMKIAFLLSVAVGIVTVIAVAMVWSVLGAAGVWDSINSSVQEVIGGETGQSFDVEDYVGTSRVVGFTMIVAVIDVILMTAIATLGAFLYNLAATLLGGLEVTLAEDER